MRHNQTAQTAPRQPAGGHSLRQQQEAVAPKTERGACGAQRNRSEDTSLEIGVAAEVHRKHEQCSGGTITACTTQHL